jgi:exopolyphosphatase/guanosine-5'-triphosphate,3'-diphosphate pyrophosphatase
MPVTKKRISTEHIAVVDIGSNSVRLVIYRHRGNVFTILHDKKSDCRLAESMNVDTPRLSDRGMKKTLKALEKFNKIITKHRITKVLAIGTAAMRAVESTAAGRQFHKRAEKALGHYIAVISGQVEAKLTAQGVLSALPNASGICADLGGGSLELAALHRGQAEAVSTLKLGALTLLSETRGDSILAIHKISERLKSANSLCERGKGKTFYVIGGSWRAIGRVMMKRRGRSIKNVHGYSIAASTALRQLRAMAFSSPDSFRAMPAKISQRADYIPIAAMTLLLLIETIRPKKIMFSCHGVREGLVRQGHI